MQRRGTLVRVSVLVAGLLWPWSAHAGCGQSFCTLDARVGPAAPLLGGQLRFDTNVEYIEQDESWVGYHPVGVGAIARPDHAEVETTNVTWKLLTELAIGDHWSASVLLPVVHREHFYLEVPGSEHAHARNRRHAGSGAHSDEPDATFDALIVTRTLTRVRSADWRICSRSCGSTRNCSRCGRESRPGNRVKGHITVTGGEPFVRADFIDLLHEFATRADYRAAVAREFGGIKALFGDYLAALDKVYQVPAVPDPK